MYRTAAAADWIDDLQTLGNEFDGIFQPRPADKIHAHHFTGRELGRIITASVEDAEKLKSAIETATQSSFGIDMPLPIWHIRPSEGSLYAHVSDNSHVMSAERYKAVKAINHTAENGGKLKHNRRGMFRFILGTITHPEAAEDVVEAATKIVPKIIPILRGRVKVIGSRATS